MAVKFISTFRRQVEGAARTRTSCFLRGSTPMAAIRPSRRYFGDSSKRASSFAVQEKRVLGAIAHINSGKTTTSEAMLYAAGALRRMGNVDVGDTTMDFLPSERERGITINAAAISFSWRNHQFFLVDSPGHLDFTYEVERALKVMDGVIVLLDAVSGVQAQTETVWRQADSNKLARIVFVNKMDRDGADFDRTVMTIRQHFLANPVVTQVPLYDESLGKFSGVYDLLDQFSDDLDDGDHTFENDTLHSLSSEQQRVVSKAVERLVEQVAGVSDEVMSLWLEGVHVPRRLLVKALRRACIEGELVPVVCGSSLKGIGVESLMDSVIKYLPSPIERSPVGALSVGSTEISVQMSTSSPFLAYAFKVTHDKHRGRMVHLRAFSGSLSELRQPFLNTTKKEKELPTKLLRVLADKFEEVKSVSAGDIFAAIGLKHTETGDTLVLKKDPESSHVVLRRVATPPAVYSVALEVDTSSQEKELAAALALAVEEDCSLEAKVDDETCETLLSGMGELHLEVAVDQMSRDLRFPIRMSRPRVAYKESITGMFEGVEAYDMTIGSNRSMATLRVSVAPLTAKEGQFRNEVYLQQNVFNAEEGQAIRDGIEGALGRGSLLGSPVTNVSVSVAPENDGNQDFGDLAALRACASKAVKNALERCRPVILEPVMRVECIIPDTTTGDVISEISHPTRRRGTIEEVNIAMHGGETSAAKMSLLRAMVPLEGMIGWATKMRSITKGRGNFSTHFDSYRAVDVATQRRILSAAAER